MGKGFIVATKDGAEIYNYDEKNIDWFLFYHWEEILEDINLSGTDAEIMTVIEYDEDGAVFGTPTLVETLPIPREGDRYMLDGEIYTLIKNCFGNFCAVCGVMDEDEDELINPLGFVKNTTKID